MRSSTRSVVAFYLSLILISGFCLTPVGWCRGEEPCEAKRT